jgi:hypothetical protein
MECAVYFPLQTQRKASPPCSKPRLSTTPEIHSSRRYGTSCTITTKSSRQTMTRAIREYGFFRSIVDDVVHDYLKCGDLKEGFARPRSHLCLATGPKFEDNLIIHL